MRASGIEIPRLPEREGLRHALPSSIQTNQTQFIASAGRPLSLLTRGGVLEDVIGKYLGLCKSAVSLHLQVMIGKSCWVVNFGRNSFQPAMRSAAVIWLIRPPNGEA